MKKLILLIMMSVFFGCNKVKENVTPTQENKKNQIVAQKGSNNNRTMYFNGLKEETKNLRERISYQDGKVSYTISRGTTQYLNDNYFHLGDSDSLHTALSDNIKFSSQNSIEDVLSKYTPQQKVVLEPFLENLQNISEDLSEVENIVNNFSTQIKNSSMSVVEKEQLQHIADGTLGVKGFIDDGGLDDIKGQLGDMLEKGCSVSARGVLSDAVLTGAGAGLRGAYVLGVKGAVFGFAAGFISGALYGIGSQLLQTCFR